MNRCEVISADVDGETRYAVMEVRPSENGVMFVVHYGPHSQSDGRTWGMDEEERHNMKVMATALLLQLASRA